MKKFHPSSKSRYQFFLPKVRFFQKNQRQTDFNFQHPSAESAQKTEHFIDQNTGRHQLDVLYERFAKPQLNDLFHPTNPSIYVRHEVGQEVWGNYIIETVFEDSPTGFYAEGRISKLGKNPPVLVIRGYGSWYPFERVLEDTPDVFLAHLGRQLKAAEKCGTIDWLKTYHQAGNSADVIGESLGGKVTQQLVAKYSDLIRSAITFNSLGVSPEVSKNSKAIHVFHYFTLGERYAFWANRGTYIPGYFFQISKAGKNWQYKLTEFIIKIASFPVKPAFFFNLFPYLFQIILSLFAQLILLSRHNEIIFNHPHPVVTAVSLNEIQPPRQNIS